MNNRAMTTNRVISYFSLGVLLLMSASMVTGERSTGQMQLNIVNPPDLYDPAPNGYSHAVVANGVSNVAFIAGQGGETLDGALSPEFDEQVRQAYRNLLSAIAAVGAEPAQVTKITTYVVDYEQSMLAVMTAAVTEVFGESLPAQTLVPVPRLALDNMLFEVDAIVVFD
ncbi:MAG: Rid family hydrolase [Pseudomonadota bacterium]